MVIDGAHLFIRYAYAPNLLGYCGPADSGALLHYGAAEVSDPALAQFARGFEGAWPYLELIARATGIDDPLDQRVVEAYWVGTPLLDKIRLADIADSMSQRFRASSGGAFAHLIDGVNAGGVPHHNFHVFAVYPWLGLLHDNRKSSTALDVLDNCRIRWGRVVSVSGDEAVVRSRPLAWDGFELSLADARLETARIACDGTGFLRDLAAGDLVSLHWDWVCDRLNPRALTQLQHFTSLHVNIANAGARDRGVPIPLG